jgi:GH15 family glucan-1,4-alpha-glucosidase
MPTFPAIEDHGLIGDLHTAALVGMDGAIDFLCAPRFDSPSLFARLLDSEKGGAFELHPDIPDPRRKQLYLPDTNILLTRFLSDDGIAEVSDFMPIGPLEEDGGRIVVRRAKAVHGHVRFRMRCAPRFDYGRTAPRIEICDGGAIIRPSEGQGPTLRLHTRQQLHEKDGAVEAEFALETDTATAFVLEILDGDAAPRASAEPRYVADTFKRTADYWRAWTARSAYQGRWREMVHRSALTLKLLSYRPEGSIVAAPTFGLPETVGGTRNWDYRFTWIRDASFTVYALVRLGLLDEAGAFVGWIRERCLEMEESGALQIMYGIDGRADLTEETLEHLAGYRGSSPVRIGNGAYDHVQLDIYGELMDSIYLYDKYGERIAHDLWNDVVGMVDWVCENWKRPDTGIWEVRGGPQEFLHSRVMCWVAVDRGIRLARKRSLPYPEAEWKETRDAIYRDVFENFWHPGKEAFTQVRGGSALDASALLMPLVRFIAPRDPRWLSTLKAIEGELMDDSLVYRYRTEEGASDGLEGVEGTFSMCSFWFAECVSRAGDPAKARFLFDKTLGYANHLGLFSEELGLSGEHLGNFPQALTHIALISAAFEIDRRLDGAPS